MSCNLAPIFFMTAITFHMIAVISHMAAVISHTAAVIFHLAAVVFHMVAVIFLMMAILSFMVTIIFFSNVIMSFNLAILFFSKAQLFFMIAIMFFIIEGCNSDQAGPACTEATHHNAPPSPPLFPDQRHEADRAELLAAEFMFSHPAHPDQGLQMLGRADRQHQPPLRRELAQ